MKEIKFSLNSLKTLLLQLCFVAISLTVFATTKAEWKARKLMDQEDSAKEKVNKQDNEEELEKPSNSKTNTPANTNTNEKPPAKASEKGKIADKEAVEKPEANSQAETNDGDISFNFQEASLANLINYMAEIKQLNLIPSPETNDVKVSLNMREIVDKQKAWEVFITLLEVSGFCIVKSGILNKVIRKDNKQIETHPIFFGVPAETLPNSSKTIRYVLFLKNIAAQEAESFLKNFLDPKTQIIAQQTMNALIITDRAEAIKHALSILNVIDNSGAKETCQIIRLNNSSASEVKKFLDELIKKPEASGLARLLGQQSEGSADFFPGNVKLIAEERTNSLIMLGTPNSLKKLENFIVEYFEGNWRIKTPFYPYECQYTEAEQVKTILDDIIMAESAASKGGSSRGGARYLGNVRIEADKYSNKLIIYSQDPKDLEMVKELLKDLDKPQPMVALETLIVQVSQNDTKEFGGQFRSRTAGQPIPSVDFQAATMSEIKANPSTGNISNILGNLIGVVQEVGQGSTVLTVGNGSKSDVWAVFKAVKSMTNTNVITNTFITVANRTKGVFNSGERRRIENEKTDTQGGFAGYGDVETSTNVTFTPQISPDGLIALEITVKISDFDGTNPGDTVNKDLNTNVTMSDGQILILGGFIKNKNSEGKNKTPGLGDIPLFGWLAKKKSRTINKSYIFIFVSPTIIKPRRSPGTNLYTKIKLHDASNLVASTTDNKKSMDPINNLFFNYNEKGNAHKVVDFANARYQPTTVDIRNDPVYRGKPIDIVLPDQEKEVSQSELQIGPDAVTLTQINTKTPSQDEELNFSAKTLLNETIIKPAKKPTTKIKMAKKESKKPRSNKESSTLKALGQALSEQNRTKEYNQIVDKTELAMATKTEVMPKKTESPPVKIIDLTAQEKPEITKPLLAIETNKTNFVLKPIETASQSESIDLELSQLINKQRKQKRSGNMDIEVASTSKQKEEADWDEELDKIFTKPANKKNLAQLTKTPQKDRSTEGPINFDELFVNSKPTNKGDKNRASALQKDLGMAPKNRGSRDYAFGKQLASDSHVCSADDNETDKFELKTAKGRNNKLRHSKRCLNFDEDEAEESLLKNSQIASAGTQASSKKLSREEKFKKLMLNNRSKQINDDAEDAETC